MRVAHLLASDTPSVHPRHEHVQQDDTNRRVISQQGEGFVPAGRGDDVEAGMLQLSPHDRPHVLVVVDDEHAAGAAARKVIRSQLAARVICGSAHRTVVMIGRRSAILESVDSGRCPRAPAGALRRRSEQAVRQAGGSGSLRATPRGLRSRGGDPDHSVDPFAICNKCVSRIQLWLSRHAAALAGLPGRRGGRYATDVLTAT